MFARACGVIPEGPSSRFTSQPGVPRVETGRSVIQLTEQCDSWQMVSPHG